MTSSRTGACPSAFRAAVVSEFDGVRRARAPKAVWTGRHDRRRWMPAQRQCSIDANPSRVCLTVTSSTTASMAGAARTAPPRRLLTAPEPLTPGTRHAHRHGGQAAGAGAVLAVSFPGTNHLEQPKLKQ